MVLLIPEKQFISVEFAALTGTKVLHAGVELPQMANSRKTV